MPCSHHHYFSLRTHLRVWQDTLKRVPCCPSLHNYRLGMRKPSCRIGSYSVRLSEFLINILLLLTSSIVQFNQVIQGVLVWPIIHRCEVGSSLLPRKGIHQCEWWTVHPSRLTRCLTCTRAARLVHCACTELLSASHLWHQSLSKKACMDVIYRGHFLTVFGVSLKFCQLY